MFGPGTRIALLGVVGVLAYSVFTQQAASASPNLSEMRARLASEPPPPPLRKPEVAELLRADLKLSKDQRTRIEAQAARWQSAKGALLAAMRSFAVEGRTTEPSLRAGLEEYAGLSRRYDAERERYWQAARAVLTAEQRRAVDAHQGGTR